MRKSETGLWLAAAVPSFWSWSYAMTRGSDLWWHLAGGRWTAEHGRIPLADPFSFTAAGRPWLNDAWLSDLILHWWSSSFGLHALAWWKWSLVVGMFLLLLWTLARLNGARERAIDAPAAYLACLLALAVAAPFLDMRPQLFSFLGVVALFALTLERPRPSWMVPLLFLVWVNLHAGVLFGLFALPILLLPAFWQGDAATRRRVALVVVLSAAACLANPNGAEVFTRPLRYAFDAGSPFRTIGEWQPPFRAGGLRSPLYPAGIAAFVAAAVVLAATAARRGVRALPPWVWTGLALGIVTLAMSLRSRRFIPLFAITASLVLAPVLHRLLAPVRARLPAPVLPLAAAALGVFWLAPYPQQSYAFHYMTAEDQFPVDTCDFMDANGIAGDVFAFYNWGGYLHLRTAGRLRVFIDGRAEAVFDDGTYRQYLEVLRGAPGWTRIVEDSAAPYFLWPRERRGQTTELVRSGRWRPLYEDTVSVLLVRTDHPLPAETRPPPPSGYREMAAGVFRLERGLGRAAVEHLERALDAVPYLNLACELLARAHAAGGDVNAGWWTLARCQETYPVPGRAAQFATYVAGLERRQ